MNETLDNYMSKVLKLIDAWEDQNSEEVAKDLNLMLTVIKLMITSAEFDELPAFRRYLDETSLYLKNLKIAEQKAKYPDMHMKLDEAGLNVNGVEILR